MVDVALARINNFAHDGPVEIVEVPVVDLQGLFADILQVHNLLAEAIEEAGILRGRELARLTKRNEEALKAERDPLAKIMLLNAFIKQHITKIRDALKTRPKDAGKLIQVVSKIQARAVQICDYIKTTITEDPFNRKEISLDSQQSRLLFSGKDGGKVSRRDTIRAMKRVEALWPALRLDHRPGDGRQTMRLTAKVQDLQGIQPEFEYRSSRQRSNMDDIKIMFNLA